jgi:acetyl esterase/lipase
MISLVKTAVIWIFWTSWKSAWNAFKLALFLVTKLPILSYVAWAGISSLAVLAALSPQLVSQYRPLIRKAALVNCVILSIASECPHLLILMKVFFIFSNKVWGTYASILSWPSLMFDVLSIIGCLGVLYQQAEDVSEMVEQASPFLSKDRTRFEPFRLLHETVAPMWREDDIECYKDVGYFGPEQLRENSVQRLVLEDLGTMDVYTSGFTPGANKPVIINIHGGSWSRGSNKEPNAVLSTIVQSKEMLIMNINFRLAPRFPLPAAIIDVKRAIAFAKRSARAYGGNPDNIFLMGDSSGGHCALVAALTGNHKTFQADDVDADTSVQGAILLCPALDPTNTFDIHHRSNEDKWFIREICGGDPDAAALVHPTQYASKDMPPMLSLHGTTDTLVDIENSRRFKAKCADIGAEDKFTLVELAYAHHAYFLFRSMRTVAAGYIAADWVKSQVHKKD